MSTCHFNTSHVTVYRYHSTSFFFATFISIHLMLLFILIVMWLANRFHYFNTSHVTVYRAGVRNVASVSIFQYISCYCLSIRSHIIINSIYISIHLMLLFIILSRCSPGFVYQFQYISCYCLSNFSAIASITFTDFNTSHVTVYLTS